MTREVPIRVPVPVVKPLPDRLVRDCAPRTGVPATGALTVGDALERLAAVEDAIAICRNQLGEIRAAQP